MSKNVILSDDKKLHVIYRLEAGCLGPKGVDYIKEFCVFAKSRFDLIDSDFILWEILSRDDKALPEIDYKINHKKLSQAKTEKYLAMLDINIDEFEEKIHGRMPDLIEEYFEANK